MKKTFYAMALALVGLSSCTNEVLNDVDAMGTIVLSVSNDEQVTRAAQTVEDLSAWIVKANDGSKDISLTTTSTKVKAGTYSITAMSHTDAVAALAANNGWGAAYYEGFAEDIVVAAGQTATAEISCGKAKNGRITTSFNLAAVFTDVSITLDRNLTFKKENENQKAYFAPSEVSYTLKYKYNGSNEISKQGTVVVAAATEHIISVSSNSNGTITVNITYDDTFEDGKDQNINFDAATGEEVQK